MPVHNVSSKNEFNEKIKGDQLVVVDMFATWCGPCKVIAPLLVKMSDKHTEALFLKVDVDELSDVAAELGVRAMPTFLFFKNGEKVAEVVGANANQLAETIEKHK